MTIPEKYSKITPDCVATMRRLAAGHHILKDDADQMSAALQKGYVVFRGAYLTITSHGRAFLDGVDTVIETL